MKNDDEEPDAETGNQPLADETGDLAGTLAETEDRALEESSGLSGPPQRIRLALPDPRKKLKKQRRKALAPLKRMCKQTTTTGVRCKRYATIDSPYCKKHTRDPRFIRGTKADGWRRYDNLKSKLRGYFERALLDAELYEPARDLAMLDAQIAELLEFAQTKDTRSWRKQMSADLEELYRLYHGGNRALFEGQLGEVKRKAREGADQLQLSDKIFDLVDRRAERLRRIQETELRKSQIVTMQDMVVIFSKWLEVLEVELEEDEFLRLVPVLRSVSGLGRGDALGMGRELVADGESNGSRQLLAGPGLGGSGRE